MKKILIITIAICGFVTASLLNASNIDDKDRKESSNLNATNGENSLDSYAVYYSDKAPIEEFDKYKLLVLDSKYHPPLAPLSARGKVLLGYISLGEVEKERAHFQEIKSLGLLIKENENWPGSYYVEMRDGKWAKKIIEDVIPEILRKGFDGIFLDTLDNPAELEEVSPEKYRGMKRSATNLVKAIRLHYPQIKIMMNRGYAILPDVVNDIDMVMGESVFADYNFKDKVYGMVAKKDYEEQVEILNEARKKNPSLGIYTLDYWDKNDPKGIKKIYAEQRKNGFVPYVSTIELNEIIPEPGE